MITSLITKEGLSTCSGDNERKQMGCDPETMSIEFRFCAHGLALVMLLQMEPST